MLDLKEILIELTYLRLSKEKEVVNVDTIIKRFEEDFPYINISRSDVIPYVDSGYTNIEDFLNNTEEVNKEGDEIEARITFKKTDGSVRTYYIGYPHVKGNNLIFYVPEANGYRSCRLNNIENIIPI